MSIAIKLPDELIKEARRFGTINSRSVPRQIEYWSRIGKIAEQNPDLPFDFIKKILVAQMEAGEGETTPYRFN